MTESTIDALAGRYGVTKDAVRTLLDALRASGGTLAQFNHPELGGMGQWSFGGMTMIGDMFNTQLKNKVAALSCELASLLKDEFSEAKIPPSSSGESATFIRLAEEQSNRWWGADFGRSSANGSQNGMRYAYFPASRRLAIQFGDEVTIYDTGDYQISGASQQQSRDTSLSFVSQRGAVPVETLRVIEKRR